MARSGRSNESSASTRVVLRLVVFGVFVATLVLAGPRALRIAEVKAHEMGLLERGSGSSADPQQLRSRSSTAPLCFFEPIPSTSGPGVALGRVQVDRAPEWIDRPTFQAMAEELETRFRGQVGIRDEDRIQILKQFVGESPWLREVVVEPLYPDRLKVSVVPRRPELKLRYPSGPSWLVDSDGVLIPAPRTAVWNRLSLPIVELEGTSVAEAGSVSEDPRVLAAVAVAIEWREEIAPRFPKGPELTAIDSRNLYWQFIQDLKQSEVLVGLRAADGETVWFQSGRAARDGGRIDGTARADVLEKILRRFPGLRGLAAGDLRLRNTWAEAISRRS